MSGDYFDFAAALQLSEFTKARASEVNAVFTALETGLALLPGKDALNQQRVTTVTATGTGNAQVITLSPAPASLTDGLFIRFKPVANNTGAVTVNVNGIGAVALKKRSGDDLVADDLEAGVYTDIIYDGTRFVLETKSGLTASDIDTASIAAGAVTNAKLADMAQATVKGRAAGAGTGAPTNLSAAQLQAIIGSGDLLASNNLSDVANAATAAQNLGLEIGVDVQAFSSVLAATTASFLTADETKLDGIEAAADVTDEANVTSALNGATLTAVAVATGDKVLVQDASDADNLKTVTAQAIADLANTTRYLMINITAPATAVETADPAYSFIMPFAASLSDIAGSLVTAQTSGSALTIDLHTNGTTNLSTLLTFDNGETVTSTASTPPVISDAVIAAGELVEIIVTQVGDGTAAGLIITLTADPS